MKRTSIEVLTEFDWFLGQEQDYWKLPWIRGARNTTASPGWNAAVIQSFVHFKASHDVGSSCGRDLFPELASL